MTDVIATDAAKRDSAGKGKLPAPRIRPRKESDAAMPDLIQPRRDPRLVKTKNPSPTVTSPSNPNPAKLPTRSSAFGASRAPSFSTPCFLPLRYTFGGLHPALRRRQGLPFRVVGAHSKDRDVHFGWTRNPCCQGRGCPCGIVSGFSSRPFVARHRASLFT